MSHFLPLDPKHIEKTFLSLLHSVHVRLSSSSSVLHYKSSWHNWTGRQKQKREIFLYWWQKPSRWIKRGKTYTGPLMEAHSCQKHKKFLSIYDLIVLKYSQLWDSTVSKILTKSYIKTIAIIISCVICHVFSLSWQKWASVLLKKLYWQQFSITQNQELQQMNKQKKKWTINKNKYQNKINFILFCSTNPFPSRPSGPAPQRTCQWEVVEGHAVLHLVPLQLLLVQRRQRSRQILHRGRGRVWWYKHTHTLFTVMGRDTGFFFSGFSFCSETRKLFFKFVLTLIFSSGHIWHQIAAKLS